MRYVTVWSLQRGIIPPEPVSKQTQAVLESQDRYEATLAAERVLWDHGYGPRPNREVA